MDQAILHRPCRRRNSMFDLLPILVTLDQGKAVEALSAEVCSLGAGGVEKCLRGCGTGTG
jgi:hypothetical protein